uniref:Uncharacterized protein n=1 Tax=Siphoviridae sp. ctrok7 TaxID=2826480 RepID=A0A8S5NE53_9CAUD|nr:MAG TPA: hypothetical protein [Siphoviridae sp. ctrok7]
MLFLMYPYSRFLFFRENARSLLFHATKLR